MTGEDIKEIRRRLCVSQRALAERLGVTVHAVRKWEQGQRKVKGAVLKILQAER